MPRLFFFGVGAPRRRGGKRRLRATSEPLIFGSSNNTLYFSSHKHLTMPDFDIEQVNKVRLAMGMKPLPVPGAPAAPVGPVFKDASSRDAPEEEALSTYDTRQAVAGDNWKKLQDEEAAKAKRQAKKDAIRKAQEAAQRNVKLEGKGLADDDEIDTKAWLVSHKKKQQKLEKARKLEKELTEREQLAQYTAADLAGVKVGHELDQFDEGGEQVLTLKDAAVDADSEEDELENIDLRAMERLNERLEAKKRKPVYNPNDDDGLAPHAILSQYDEEIDGKRRKKFTLDGEGSSRQAALEAKATEPNKVKGVKISLDIFKDDTPISDYKEAKEVKIKKPKKSKSKSKRKALDDDDIFHIEPETGAEEDVEMGNGEGALGASKKRKTGDASFVDDDELQANLAAQRRAALKKRKKMTPEELARTLRDDDESARGVMDTVEPEEEPGLVIDEVSEFVTNLQKPSAAERRKSNSRQPSIATPEPNGVDDDSDGDVEMKESYANAAEAEDTPRDTPVPAESTEAAGTGLEEEATLNQGIGATLNMLHARGIIKTADSGDINAIHRERQRFLADKQKRAADADQRARDQRERDRRSGKLEHMSAREREAYAQRTNANRDQAESRAMADVFNREYRPDVQLKYVDEFGRNMSQKEAFKHLSHQFHGKGSGKQKTEKRMKKIEDEKKREAMSVLDASTNSTNMNSAVEGRAKKARQAGVRLQ
jgi:U4/U6.U5 tri-snRNP-associated protein 1